MTGAAQAKGEFPETAEAWKALLRETRSAYSALLLARKQQ